MKFVRTQRPSGWGSRIGTASLAVALAVLTFSAGCKKAGEVPAPKPAKPSRQAGKAPTESPVMKQLRAEVPEVLVRRVLSDARAVFSGSNEARARWRDPEEGALLYYRSLKLLADVARAEGLTSNPIVLQYVHNTLLQAYADKLFERSKTEIPISEDEIKKYYGDHLPQYHVRGHFSFRQIFLNTVDNPGKEKEKETLANKALKELDAGTSFVQVAEKYSDNESKDEIIRPRAFGEINPDLEKVILELEPGQSSKVVRTKYGFNIFHLEELERPTTQTLESVRDSIVQGLQQEQLPAFRERFASQMEARFPVKKNYELLRDSKAPDDALVVDSKFLKITVGDCRKRLNEMPPDARKQLEIAENRADFLDNWIEMKRIEQAAQGDGLIESPELKTLERYLNDEALAGVSLMQAVARMPLPKENDVVQHYKDYYDSYVKQPAMYRLREIVLPYRQPDGTLPRQIYLARQQAKAQADEVVEKLKAGAKFEELIKQYSKAPSVQKDGELGFMDPDRRWNGLRKQLEGLKVGQWTQPVDEGEQFTIFQYEEIKPEVAVPLDDTLKGQIKEILTQELRNQRSAYIRIKLGEAYRKDMTVDETRKFVQDLVAKTEEELKK